MFSNYSRNIQQKFLYKIDKKQAVHCMPRRKAADEMQKVPMLSLQIQKFKHSQLPHKSKFVIKLHLNYLLAKTSGKASRYLLVIFLTTTQETFPG